ncbi:hypothetical protein [Streptomyces sp. TUS-ST3]|uniref:hypothetical protein n=1 Tax=Streptomyces sp. TUS-ST3 TaxID=3025591 RepID=UPI0032EA79E6
MAGCARAPGGCRGAGPVARGLPPDVCYDLSDFGQGELTGLDAIEEAALALGMADGSCGSVTYEDTVVRVGAGWRISHRRVPARRVPLNGLGQG